MPNRGEPERHRNRRRPGHRSRRHPSVRPRHPDRDWGGRRRGDRDRPPPGRRQPGGARFPRAPPHRAVRRHVRPGPAPRGCPRCAAQGVPLPPPLRRPARPRPVDQPPGAGMVHEAREGDGHRRRRRSPLEPRGPAGALRRGGRPERPGQHHHRGLGRPRHRPHRPLPRRRSAAGHQPLVLRCPRRRPDSPGRRLRHLAGGGGQAARRPLPGEAGGPRPDHRQRGPPHHHPHRLLRRRLSPASGGRSDRAQGVWARSGRGFDRRAGRDR